MRKNLPQFLSFCFLVLVILFAKSSYGLSNRPDTIPLFKATVLDESQAPLQRVKIQVQGTKTSVLTEANGAFAIPAKINDVLLLSFDDQVFLKYKIESLSVNAIIVSSQNPVVKQHRMVKMMFGIEVPANRTPASVDVVYNADLTKMPVTSVANALTGRLSGLYTLQSSGQPGADGASLSLRGRTPAVFIDGVPRGFSIVNLDEIESVTVLKDALASGQLGGKGFNGAVLINTRRGTNAKQSISFTAQTAFQQSLKYAQPLDAFNYASLYNEALTNNGLATVYTQADLTAYQNQSDPYGHPNVNWVDQVLKENTRLDQYNINFRGGNEWGRYFVSMQHLNQTGFLQTSPENNYDTNNKFKSYVVRSNVDVNITKSLSAGINLLGRILNSNDPGYINPGGNVVNAQGIFSAVINTPRNAYPVFNPNGSYGTSPNFQTNLYGQSVNSGYVANYKRDVLADLFVKRTLDEITKGLWVRAAVALSSTISENNNRTKSFASFYYNPTTKTYTQYGNNGIQGNSNFINYQGRADYLELKLGYDRSFGKSDVSSVLFANRDNIVSGSDLPYTLKGLAGRTQYTYNNTYTAELAYAVNGSNYYPPSGDNKYGFYPSAGLSWTVSNEKFFPKNSFVNDLRIFSSYGVNGNDNPGYFTYIQRYFDGPAVYFGSSAGSNTSIFEQPLARTNLTFEKANKFNLGLQTGLFQNKLGLKVEYYNNKFYDLLMQRGKNSTIIGQTYPDENIGQYRYTGLDFNLNWQQAISKQASYFIVLSGGLQNSEVVYIDEVNQPYPWMRKTGEMVGQTFGYLAEGLFQNQTEINNSAKLVGYTAQPGDIRYRDLNGDNIINQFDQTAIGQNKPLLFMGLSLGFQFKSFDFSALIQGVANRKIYLSGNTEWAFQNNGLGQAWEHSLDRWTPATAASATYPRLTVGTNINNEATSTFWMKSGDYLRLKNIEIGYSLPKSLLNRIKLSTIRVFASGTNLLTFSAYDRVDPEVYNGTYPLQRLLNVGVNIKF
ncbi:SusC/RagA family TonB-linked outer membrane protein [Pedobacter rhizosphaerae]|uniref:TonB-linked outer membrane protein, SusC/RagA family n=1 Tax=Pedobacter rhizosphaerae TaxID=390241 RepID=A0A1H9MLV6_9SPHI|nr:SusC/RagA family TonB-linked outer membrane protein [Pedobacter rhizosphaerae]SER24672.1 TonB-linked outer membrane protein, SusC/RagA family [Pedobacter rhizosphaerae]